VTGVIGLLELLELLLAEYRRFYACLLMAMAISGLVLTFVPGRTLSIILSLVAFVSGIVGGVGWERASR